MDILFVKKVLGLLKKAAAQERTLCGPLPQKAEVK